MSIKAARIETKQTLMTLTWSHQKTTLIFKMTRFVLCISFGEIIPNLTIEWYAQPATRSFWNFRSHLSIRPGPRIHQNCMLSEYGWLHPPGCKNGGTKKALPKNRGQILGREGRSAWLIDEGFTKVFECVPHEIFGWSCCCCLVCSFGGVGGRSGVALGCWRMVVVGSWSLSFKRWIAWQRHGNHWRVIPTDLLKFNLLLKKNWAAYFDWHREKATQTETNHPKLDWNQPPKIHPKKPTNHEKSPQTEATFPSISYPFFVSGRLSGSHGWTTLQGDALGDSLCELCLSGGGMSAQPLREGVVWLGRWLSSWVGWFGWVVGFFLVVEVRLSLW